MNIKLQTNEQLSVTVANGLAGVFVNGVSLSANLSAKADLTSLQNYYTKSETSSSSEISNELKKYQLSGNYYQKSETSSATEISTAFENAGGKVYFDNRISGVTGSNDLSVVKLSADEYAQMLDGGTCLSNAIYIVDAPNIDAFRRQIKNVAYPTDLSDAATKGYVDNKVSSIQIPTDLSAFANSPGYLVSNDVKISYSNQTIWLSSKAYVTSVDCTDFIKDGMLSTVELCGTTLVLTFNTDAGSDPISVELSNFVDNYDEKISSLSDHIDQKVFISNSISGVSDYNDLSVIKLSADEYASLLTSNGLLSNAIYIVEDSYVNAYGQQIKNVAPAVDLSDAVNLEQLRNELSSKQDILTDIQLSAIDYVIDKMQTTIAYSDGSTSAFNITREIDSTSIPSKSLVTDAKIGDGIVVIGENAFNGCSSLSNVAIPGSVLSIGLSAFAGCSSLEMISIPYSVEYIADNAFSNCSSLQTVVIGNCCESPDVTELLKQYNIIIDSI